MVGINDLKIQKRTYQFDVKKRYSNEQKYKKVERPPIEKIKEALQSFLKPKEKLVLEGEEPEQKKEVSFGGEGPEKKPAAKPLVSPKMMAMAGGAALLFILLMASVVVFFQSTVYPAEAEINPLDKAQLSAEILSYDILTASEKDKPRQPYHTAFVRLGIGGEGIEELQVNLLAYNSPVPSSVYVLRSHSYQAESYPEFFLSLKKRLSAAGISVNEVGVNELGSLPSQSLIIVPSGYIPQQLLYERGSRITDLLNRGATVMYIGQPFYRMHNLQGAVVSATPAALDPFRVAFDETTPLSSQEGFRLRSPLYSISGSTLIFGSVSAISYGKGYLVTLPQTLDGGWENGELAAEDAARLVAELPWLSPVGTVSETISIGENMTMEEFFTSTFEGDSKYLRVYAYDNNTGTGFNKVIYAHKSTRGEIYTDGHDLRPSGLGPTQMDIFVHLNEPGGEARLFFTVTQLLSEVDRTSVAAAQVALNSRPTFPYTFSIPSGNYILNIIDEEGRAYARAYMRAGDLEIRRTFQAFTTDVYRYSFYLDGASTPVTGSVQINGNPAHSMSFQNQASIEIKAAEIAGGPLAANEVHTFTFKLGEYTFTESIRKTAARSIFEDPLILGAIGIAVVALAIGFLFARQGVTMYGLDIPDFPPQSTKKIPMKKETLLGVFQKINEKYKWKNTPLTLSEVKSGFRDILHEGKPVFISDYNLEYLLFRLSGMGLAKKELNYYGLASWEEESGTSVRRLAFFRKLRDICINNAVQFTQLGKEKGCDSRITVLGQDIFVHLYDEAVRVIPGALFSLRNGLNIIVFEEEAEKSEFYEYLSNGQEGSTALKLEIQAGSVLLKTWDELAEMIKEMKV